MAETRLGIMGGTFDPIHHGHLVAASEAAYLFQLDRVIFVPAGVPWHRAAGVSPAEDRFAMTEAAVASNPKFTSSRVDVDRGSDTFTVDTLRDLRAELGPEPRLFFITGADAIAQIMSWHGARNGDLFAAAEFIAVTRPGHDLGLDHMPDGAVVHPVEVPAMAISSTDCRHRVATGRPIRYLVPDAVAEYVAAHGLYQPRSGGREKVDVATSDV